MMLWSQEVTVTARKILEPVKRKVLYFALCALVCCAVFTYAREIAVAALVMIGALYLTERALS